MRIGIDFGTTHTSAAFYNGRKLTFIPLDKGNSNARVLRSMIYVDRDQRVRLGMDAVTTFLKEDTGRPVVYEEKVVGTIENTVAQATRSPLEPDGPITIIYDVTINDDVGAFGRLLQSIKTVLRSPSYKGTQIFGKYYTIQELIALILRHVRKRAKAHFRCRVDQVVLGRPVAFSTDPEIDRLAESRLREAATLAGFKEITFLNEPIAAGLFSIKEQPPHKNVFIFDFGGGTLDMTVLRTEQRGEADILASKGLLIGGDDIDSAIMRERVALYFGAKSIIDVNYDGRPIPFPESYADLLYRWQTIPELTRPKSLAAIQRGIQYGAEPAAFAALEALVMNNYGFTLFEQIEQAKRRLSTELEAQIAMQIEQINVDMSLSRRELNLLMGDQIADVHSGIDELMESAGMPPEQIDIVVTTGGSSVVPAFQNLLKKKFPTSKVVQSDLFGSTTAGLAIQAHSLG